MASPLDGILKKMEAHAATRIVEIPAATMAPTASVTPVLPSEIVKQQEAMAAHRKEMSIFKERAQRHMRRLAEDKALKWTQYPPMDLHHRHVVATVADEAGFVSHEFGEEEIDRFIIVYKSEHAPSPEEVARMTLKHTHKLPEESVARIIEGPSEPAVDLESRRKKSKVDAAVEDSDAIVGQLHAVGTVKRVRRNAVDVLEEVKQKKRLEKIVAIDTLFDDRDERDEEQGSNINNNG